MGVRGRARRDQGDQKGMISVHVDLYMHVPRDNTGACMPLMSNFGHSMCDGRLWKKDMHYCPALNVTAIARPNSFKGKSREIERTSYASLFTWSLEVNG